MCVARGYSSASTLWKTAGPRRRLRRHAQKAWEFALDRGLITQFGSPGGNVLKFKPPLTTPQADFDCMLEIVEQTVAFIQREVDQQRKAISEPASIAG